MGFKRYPVQLDQNDNTAQTLFCHSRLAANGQQSCAFLSRADIDPEARQSLYFYGQRLLDCHQHAVGVCQGKHPRQWQLRYSGVAAKHTGTMASQLGDEVPQRHALGDQAAV